MTSLARDLLRAAAEGVIPGGLREALAEAVLSDRRVKLAEQVLQDDERSNFAAIELAALVLAEQPANRVAGVRTHE